MNQTSQVLVSGRTVASLHERAETFIAETLADANADGVVLALDGGLETATLATIATDALGPEHVTPLVMPAYLTSEAAARNAEAIARSLSLTPERVQLQPLLGAFRESMGEAGVPADDAVAVENALARLRMTCLYYVANTTNTLVAGAATRTDRLLGTVTKHGTLGVDILPFGAYYRSEIETLATRLDVPEVAMETPGAGFTITERDSERLGVTDHTLDSLLVALVAEEQTPRTAAETAGVEEETATRVADWIAATAHKRRPPEMA